jgi:hypothetical protein
VIDMQYANVSGMERKVLGREIVLIMYCALYMLRYRCLFGGWIERLCRCRKFGTSGPTLHKCTHDSCTTPQQNRR